MLHRVVFIFVVITVMTFALTTLAGVVSVEKSVPIYRGDVLRSRQEAISKGLQEAVLIHSIKIMQHQPTEEELTILNERLLKEPTIFIGNYRIIKEFIKDNQVNVIMEVNVTEEPLEESLSKLGLIQISEKGVENNIYRVTLINVDNYKIYNEVRNNIKNSEGVTEIKLLKMTPGTLILEITSKESLDVMVSYVMDSSYQGFKVGTREQTDRSVELVITEFGQE